MDSIERVEAMLAAIASVKIRAHLAYVGGDLRTYRVLMEDLMSLECLLPDEAGLLLSELKKAA